MGNSGKESKSSAPKIALGCGCVTLFILIGLGTAAYIFVPKMVERVQTTIGDTMADMEFAKNWQPPADDISAIDLFPPTIGNYYLFGVGDKVDVGILGITSADAHARYVSDEKEIRVFMIRASNSERQTIYDNVDRAIDEQEFSMVQRIKIDDAFTFKVSSPAASGKLWWSNDWLFFFYERKLLPVAPDWPAGGKIEAPETDASTTKQTPVNLREFSKQFLSEIQPKD